MLESHLVLCAASAADRISPDVGAGFLFLEGGFAFAVDAVWTFVEGEHLFATADGGSFQGIEGLRRAAFGEHEHELPAVRVGVGAHEGGVLLLVDHRVVHAPSQFLEHKSLAETGHGSAAVDFVSHDPHDHPACLGDPKQLGGYALGIKFVALVLAQLIVGRRSYSQIYRILWESAHRFHAVTDNEAVCWEFCGHGVLVLWCADKSSGECSGGLVAAKKVSLAISEYRVSGLYFLWFCAIITHVCIIGRGVTSIVLGRQEDD